MGGAPITHGEIESWQHNTGIDLDAWQAKTLRRLSYEYLTEQHHAQDPLRPAPYLPSTTEQELQQSQAQRMRSNLRSLAGHK